MARRVKKRRKRISPETELRLDDFQCPGEKRVYWEGVGGTAALFILIAYNITRFGVMNEAAPGGPLYHQYWIPAAVVLYPLLTWFVANSLALRPRRRVLKEAGMNARVLNKNYPKLKAILAEQSKVLDIDEPEMYILSDDTPYMYTLPGKNSQIVTNDAMLDVMNDEELALMIAREMGHIKARHPRMAIVVTFMRRTNAIVKVLLFPITMMAAFLRGWLELIEITADRMALLITGRAALMNAAVVKLAVAADHEAEISRPELEAYLEAGDMMTDSSQIERHFKMGEFLGRQPHLRERIEEVTEFLRTAEGQAALQKVNEAKQRLA